MIERKAFFTPSPDSVPKLVARLLFAAPEDKLGVSFQVGTLDYDSVDKIPNLEEITLNPLEKIETTKTGFELIGRRIGTENIIGRLVVDMTVEPPVATYTEQPTSDQLAR